MHQYWLFTIFFNCSCFISQICSQVSWLSGWVGYYQFSYSYYFYQGLRIAGLGMFLLYSRAFWRGFVSFGYYFRSGRGGFIRYALIFLTWPANYQIMIDYILAFFISFSFFLAISHHRYWHLIHLVWSIILFFYFYLSFWKSGQFLYFGFFGVRVIVLLSLFLLRFSFAIFSEFIPFLFITHLDRKDFRSRTDSQLFFVDYWWL